MENKFGKLVRATEHALLTDYNIAKRVVDVAINVYGKPNNTAATLYSLIKNSGQWIDKIYFVEERRQPFKSDFSFIKEAFSDRIIHFKPKIWLHWIPINFKFLYKSKFFRQSIRYQYAWERTDKDYLFIIHNDVLFEADILGSMLAKIEEHVGIGQVGQCWNCSAFFAGKCAPDNFLQYRPTPSELKELFRQYPGKRMASNSKMLKKSGSWPLPECRLNEWSALINIKKARQATLPNGRAIPFGAFYGVDIGVQWFHDVHNMGFSVANFPLGGYAHHSWSSLATNGHSALFNSSDYEYTENTAFEYLESCYRDTFKGELP